MPEIELPHLAVIATTQARREEVLRLYIAHIPRDENGAPIGLAPGLWAALGDTLIMQVPVPKPTTRHWRSASHVHQNTAYPPWAAPILSLARVTGARFIVFDPAEEALPGLPAYPRATPRVTPRGEKPFTPPKKQGGVI